jgi:hypothetical protein
LKNPPSAWVGTDGIRPEFFSKPRLRDDRGGLFFIHDSPYPPLHALLGIGPVLRCRALPKASDLRPIFFFGIGFFSQRGRPAFANRSGNDVARRFPKTLHEPELKIKTRPVARAASGFYA